MMLVSPFSPFSTKDLSLYLCLYLYIVEYVSHLVTLFNILNDRGVLVLCYTGGLILGLAYLSNSDEVDNADIWI